jgi:hypothetical protein
MTPYRRVGKWRHRSMHSLYRIDWGEPSVLSPGHLIPCLYSLQAATWSNQYHVQTDSFLFKNREHNLLKFYSREGKKKKVQVCGGTRWRSWLRHCATNRKVASSIPDEVSGIFNWLSPSDRIMALESTQPLTETSTRYLPWGVKTAGA